MLATRPTEEASLTLGPLGVRDGSCVRAALSELSPESMFQRFGYSCRAQDVNLAWVEALDMDSCAAVGARENNTGRLVGWCRYVASPDEPTRGEVAATVVDRWQSLRVGSELMAQLAAAALDREVNLFTAQVRRENTRARRLMAGVGHCHVVGSAFGVIEIHARLVARPGLRGRRTS